MKISRHRRNQNDMPLTTLRPIPDHPLVSVVAPSFNHAKFLEDTINSVLQQDYEPLELIIVDGGSTDGTLDILRKYQHDPRVRWISEPDQGPSDAINKGLKLAKGHLIGLMPVTDTYVPGAIREIVQGFASDPLMALVGGWVNQMDEHGSSIDYASLRPDIINYTADDVVVLTSVPALQATLFRRDIALAIGGIDLTFKTSDFIFVLHYMLETARRGAHIRSVPKVWANYRMHSDQQHLQADQNALVSYLDRVVAYKGYAETYKRFLTRNQVRLLRRTSYYMLLRYRVRTLHQIVPAIPATLGYIWYGRGPHLLGQPLAYVFRKKAWLFLFRMAASEFMSLLRLLRILR